MHDQEWTLSSSENLIVMEKNDVTMMYFECLVILALLLIFVT
jgi:hypothetical protein